MGPSCRPVTSEIEAPRSGATRQPRAALERRAAGSCKLISEPEPACQARLGPCS